MNDQIKDDEVVTMAHIGKNRNVCRVLVGKHEGKRLGTDKKIILKWFLKNRLEGHGLD